MSAAENEVLDPEVDLDAVDEDEELEGEQPEGTEDDSAEEGEGDEVSITLGEDPPPSDEDEGSREWVRELRKTQKELRRENAELKQKLQTAPTAEQVVEVGPKPTLESSEYDEDKFAEALKTWLAKQREVEDKAEAKTRAANAAQAEFQATVAKFEKAKTALRVSDFDDAEAWFKTAFSPTQQGLLLDTTLSGESATQLVYALFKNPKEAQPLAALIDKPVKFVAAVARLESKLKVTPRNAAPLPERTVRGNAPISGKDTQLERLRAEADKSGDRSKVASYMRAQKQKAK